jgi:phenylacetic acid degradation operon negative regulatory protein
MINKKDLENFKEFLESGSTKADITKVVLVSLILTSLPAVALGGAFMGNAVQLFHKKKKYTKRQISAANFNLKKGGYIEYVSDKNGVATIRITRKGVTKLKSFSLELITIKKPRSWDGKWRVVMFDLPLKYKKVRDALRFKLKQMGFIQLQKSVWVHPYNCIDEILFISDYYKVSRYIDILIVDEILKDIKLRKHFKL